MADNTENIGGVSVSITGDYSQLAGDFDAAVALAVSKGATLAEAIKSAMAVPDTAPLTQAFGVVGDSAVTAAGQLKLFDEAAHVNYSDAAGQLNLFATELEAVGPTAAQAAQGVMQLPVALGQAGEKAHETEGLFVEFGEKVSEIIEHPIQQFRALVEAMGPVAIGALALAAAFYEVGKQITELVLDEAQAARENQNLADKLNLTFDETKQLSEMASVVGVNIDSLARVSMRLADALDDPAGKGKAVASALEGMGIVASTSGDAMLKLLEHLAEIPDATERINQAHLVMGRSAVQLEPLLQNYQMLSEAVEQLGGKLDSEGVAKLLAANKAAGLLSIAWDHLKESMAAAFAPAVTAGLELLTHLLTDPKPMTLDQQIESLKQEIKDLSAQAITTQRNLSSMFAASTGMVAVGPEATPELIDQRKNDLSLLEAQKGAIARSKEYNDELDRSNVNQKRWAADGAAAFKEMEKAEVEFHNSAVTLWNSLPASYDQYLSNLGEGGKTAKSIMDSIESDLNRAATVMVGMKGAPLAAMQEWVAGLKDAQATMQSFAATDAFYTTAAKIGLLIDKFPDQVKELSDMDAGLKQFFQTMQDGAANVPDALNKVNTEDLTKKLLDTQKAIDDQIKKNTDTFTKFYDNYEERTRKAIGITDDFKVKFGELSTINVDLSERGLSAGLLDAYHHALDLNQAYKDLGITADSSGQLMSRHIKDLNLVLGDSRATLDVIELAWSRWGNDIAKLAKTDLPAAVAEYEKLIEKLRETGAAQGQLLAVQEARLKVQIALKDQTGTDATAEIIALTQATYATKALKDAAEGLGQTYVGVRKAFDDAFSSLSKGLADAIVNGKNLGDVFIKVGQQIATSILDTVIKGALLPLQDELNKTGGLFDSLAKSITGSGGLGGLFSKGASGSGEVAREGSSLPGGSAGDFGGEAGGSSGGSSGGAGSALGSYAAVAGVVVQAISGIVQGFQMARLINLLGEIEITTRKMDNVLGENGAESIFGYTKGTWQDLEQVLSELSDLHNDNVEVLGRFDELIAAVEAGGGGSGGSGGGGALSEADLLALNEVTHSLSDLAVTINSEQYANGAVNPATFAPFTAGGVGTQAYTLSQAVNANGQGFGAIANPMNLAANALSAVATPGHLAGDTTFASTVESGAAQGVSTGGATWGGAWNGFTGDTSAMLNAINTYGGDPSLLSGFSAKWGPLAGDVLRSARNRGLTDTEAMFSSPGGSLDYNAMNAYYAQHPLQQNAGNQASPTPSYLIPGTPTGSYNSGGNAAVTVNALNPSSRGVVDGIITGLRQIGVKV